MQLWFFSAEGRAKRPARRVSVLCCWCCFLLLSDNSVGRLRPNYAFHRAGRLATCFFTILCDSVSRLAMNENYAPPGLSPEIICGSQVSLLAGNSCLVAQYKSVSPSLKGWITDSKSYISKKTTTLIVIQILQCRDKIHIEGGR